MPDISELETIDNAKLCVNDNKTHDDDWTWDLGGSERNPVVAHLTDTNAKAFELLDAPIIWANGGLAKPCWWTEGEIENRADTITSEHVTPIAKGPITYLPPVPYCQLPEGQFWPAYIYADGYGDGYVSEQTRQTPPRAREHHKTIDVNETLKCIPTDAHTCKQPCLAFVTTTILNIALKRQMAASKVMHKLSRPDTTREMSGPLSTTIFETSGKRLMTLAVKRPDKKTIHHLLNLGYIISLDMNPGSILPIEGHTQKLSKHHVTMLMPTNDKRIILLDINGCAIIDEPELQTLLQSIQDNKNHIDKTFVEGVKLA